MKNLLTTLLLFTAVAAFSQKITVYTTAENTPNRLTQTATLTFAPFGQPFETQPCIFVDPKKTFQTFLGIGGALTDASAETFAKLPANKQAELLTAYFDKEKGIGYTVARTNINSCDFSSDMYTYVAEGDKSLKTFNIAHDEKFKIPFIKKAMDVAGHLELLRQPVEPASLDEGQRQHVARWTPKAGVLRCLGELLCEIHPSLRKARHPGLGTFGAKRA